MIRATYSFLDRFPTTYATPLYVVIDGDPQGSANYFRAMLRATGQANAEGFIRTNAEARLVVGHNVWPNTMYCYTFSKGEVRAEGRREPFGDEWTWCSKGRWSPLSTTTPGPPSTRCP